MKAIIKKIGVFILFCIFVTGCKEMKLPDNYELVNKNNKYNISMISKDKKSSVILVPENVTKYFVNEEYILAERVNKDTNTYYIIAIKDNKYYADMTKEKFTEKCAKLNIKNIKWKKVK